MTPSPFQGVLARCKAARYFKRVRTPSFPTSQQWITQRFWRTWSGDRNRFNLHCRARL